MKFTAFLKLFFVITVSAGINIYFLYLNLTADLRNFEDILISSNIQIEDISLKEGTLFVTASSGADNNPNGDEILLARKIFNIIRSLSVQPKNLSLKLINNSGSLLYSNLIKNIGHIPLHEETLKSITLDSGFAQFKLEYELGQNDIEFNEIKILPSYGAEGNTMQLSLVSSINDLKRAARSTIEIINDLNSEGGGVFRYNIYIKDNEQDRLLYVVSCDLIYDDLLSWQSPYVVDKVL